MKDDLQIVKTGVIDLQLDTAIIVDATSKIKSDTTVLLDETAVRLKNDLLQWICPVDYHVQHRDYIDRHQPGTGQWFLLYYSAGNAKRFGRIMEFFQCGTVKCVTTFCHFSKRGAFQKW